MTRAYSKSRSFQPIIFLEEPSMKGQAEAVLDGAKAIATTTAEDWKNTILTSLANYIDAGSIRIRLGGDGPVGNRL